MGPVVELLLKKSLSFCLSFFLVASFAWGASKKIDKKIPASAEKSCSLVFQPMAPQLLSFEKVYHSLSEAGIDYSYIMPTMLNAHAFFPELSGVHFFHVNPELKRAIAMGVTLNQVFVRDYVWQSSADKETPVIGLGNYQRIPVKAILTERDLSSFFFEKEDLIHLYTETKSQEQMAEMIQGPSSPLAPEQDRQLLFIDRVNLKQMERKTFSIDLSAFGYRTVVFKSKKKFDQHLFKLETPYEVYVLVISQKDSSVFRVLRIQKQNLEVTLSAPFRFERGSSVDYIQHDIATMEIQMSTTRRGRRNQFVWTFLNDSMPAVFEVSDLYLSNYQNIYWKLESKDSLKKNEQ